MASVKEIRTDLDSFIARLGKGESFLVLKRGKPAFRMVPVEDEQWEEAIDFTKLKKGGVSVEDLLARL